MHDSLRINRTGTSISFEIKVQPRSSRNAVAGSHDHMLKIKLTAAPVDGKANAALLSFLAKSLGISKSLFSIVRGETSSQKLIHIANCSPETERKLLELSEGSD